MGIHLLLKLTEKIANDSSLKLFTHENNLDNKVRMFDVMQNNLESKQLNLLCGSEQIAARTIPVKRLQDRKTIISKQCSENHLLFGPRNQRKRSS